MKNKTSQAIRGISIIFVIFIHVQTGIGYNLNSFSYNYWIFVHQIFNFAVPVFFFISGYYTKTDDLMERWSLNIFKQPWVVRLAVPFLVWSIIYTVIYTIIGVNTLTPMFFLRAIIKIFIGMAATQLYFIYVLIQLKLLTPLFLKYINKRYFNVVILAL